MKLDEYVRETLLAIVRGVAEAQLDQEHGELVGRAGSSAASDMQGNIITNVSFDLATTSEDKGSVGGGISVVPFVSAKAETATGTILANRIQFVLPLAIPKPAGQRDADQQRRNRDSAAIRRSAVSEL